MQASSAPGLYYMPPPCWLLPRTEVTQEPSAYVYSNRGNFLLRSGDLAHDVRNLDRKKLGCLERNTSFGEKYIVCLECVKDEAQRRYLQMRILFHC